MKTKKRKPPPRLPVARGVRRKPVCLKFAPATIQFLRSRDNQSEFVEDAIEASEAYLAWAGETKQGAATCN